MLQQVLYGIYLQILRSLENGTHSLKKVETEKKIQWLGKIWIPKLFDGEHSWTINQIDDNTVLFIQKERFTGIFIPFFTKLLKNTKSGFEMMNQNLKQRAEEMMG